MYMEACRKEGNAMQRVIDNFCCTHSVTATVGSRHSANEQRLKGGHQRTRGKQTEQKTEGEPEINNLGVIYAWL